VVILGFAILRWLDGQWWGVLLWVLASPVVYLVLDFLFFGRTRGGDEVDAKRRRRVVPSKAESLTHDPKRTPEWKSARETSVGGEILERGRRYDRRRA
jgi:hypothetical protein